MSSSSSLRKRVEVNLGGKILTLETGLMAKQAAGAVTARIGDTIVFSAITCTKTPREGVDFFPLQVEYREKFYAAGRFPGGYFKREAKPSEREILTARVTDRPLRPFFPAGYRNDVQINNALLSADGEQEPDILSVIAASAALTISEIPFFGPIAAVRVGRINGQFVVNPTHAEMEQSDIKLTYAGSRDFPIMIEGNANEISDADMVAAMKFGHSFIPAIIDAQLELRRQLGLPEKVVSETLPDSAQLAAAHEIAGDAMMAALAIRGKLERQDKVTEVKTTLEAKLKEKFPELTSEEYFHLFDAFEIESTRRLVIEKKTRIGGRGFDQLRDLYGEVAVLPRTHGSSLFARGETQSLATVTLGTSDDVQDLDAVAGGPKEKRFILHYNFPPYSVGEVGRLGMTSRRETGHGNLAERSLVPVIPNDYPYSIRVVSEIMESNGSSSMASVCAGTLALMDAGVPITKPVAGISVGLFSEADKAELVLDILGAEDHCGEMDFKVTGTRQGITGFQVDLKIRGLRWDLVEKAFTMANKGRQQILDYMQTVIDAPRGDLSPYAPRIQVLRINPEKIGALIGPGGKNIRRITDLSGAKIDIEDDGTVRVFASEKESMDIAVREIGALTAEPEVGKIYQGTVTGAKEFGAFVEFMPGKEGLVHISELADFRVKSVDDICKIGDTMWVKCLAVDEMSGKVRLSRKAAMAEMDNQG
ncbi:MAG TPA: polyribonucleotide nucleotidyltransferase [Kiritimatiellia bacterium]|nr:polyribonucleotide nucleotidyltransferase [Kiritimatiellia bacterium]HMP33278.1 polyribonucleotide nucleotidyltransferase [Kiritimatiellia bacterium]